VRLLDRLIRRAGYWEGMASGAAVLTTSYGSPDREPVLPQLAAFAQNANASSSPVFSAILVRMMLLAEARFQLQAKDDKHLYGNTSLAVLEHPWGPDSTSGELIARCEQDASVAGNSYTWQPPDADVLVRLRPDWTTIVSELVPVAGGGTYRRKIGYWWEPPKSVLDQGGGFMAPAAEVAHWCADEATEILTADGWKDFRALRAGDEALTLNHETGLSEWQPVQDVLVYPAQRREMVSMEGREFSSLTTPNHRWPVERKNSRARTYVRRWATSATIGTGDRIPVAAYPADVPQEQKWADALVEVVAWFWTEGRFKSGRYPGTKGRGIDIGQSAKNADNVARIRAALTVLFGAPVDRMPKRGPRAAQVPCWREYRDDDMVIFALSSNAGDVVTEHAPGKVVTTPFIRSLTVAQLDLFIKVSLLADNCGMNRLAQKSPAMAEQFAMACILAGHGVSFREGAAKKRGYRMSVVRMLRKRHVYPQESGREGSAFRVCRVAYDGQVWCPRIPNQTWLARRNGSVYFTGNSPVPDPQADFRGMSWLTPVMRDIQGDEGMARYKIRYLQANATPNLVIKYAQKLHPATVDSIRERMTARYGGPDNAGKTLILDQGADLVAVGNSLADMDFSNVSQDGIERILAAAGVPPLLVGLESVKGAGKSYQEVIRRFGDLTLRPLWRSLCSALEPLVPDLAAGSRLWVDTSDIAALQDGEQVRAQVTLIRAQALLALEQAGYDRMSSVKAIEAGDMGQLEEAAAPPAPPNRPVQHLLGQPGQPGVTADPLPAAMPRLPVGSTSPGDGGNHTRPTPRPSSARRALNGANGHG
jgi:hypothetical protein